VRFKPELLPQFVAYVFCTANILDELKKMKSGTTSVVGIYYKSLKNLEIPIPPIQEQKQIVALLDQAFAAIDQAKANIEKNIENAKELFQSKLNDIFSQKDDGWEIEKMVDVCSILTCGVASTPKYVEEAVGVPFLSAQNVKNGKIILHKFKYISKTFHKHLTKKNKPQKGDILYSRVGAKYGEAGVVEHDFEFSVYVSVTLVRPLPDKLNNYYLKYYLNSPLIKTLAKSSITSSGVPNLNVKTVREFPVHYPSIKKQREIVDEIQDLETAFIQIIRKYKQKVDSLEELKKSILKKAFAGELTEKAVLE
jgi:type I restriction enzyme S subunit